MHMKEIEKEFKKLEIQIEETIHNYEEFIWINHHSHVRLTIIDSLNRVAIAKQIIPRELFDREYIKYFLKTSR